MSCPRTAQIDWAAYTAEPAAGEWAELRAHYPGCPDCAREAARWLALRTALASGPDAGAAHPAEEELLDYERSPQRLPAARRQAIGRHLDDCARCSNELIVLNRMLPAGAAAAQRSGSAAAREGFWDRIRRSLASLLPSSGPALGLVATGLAVALAVGLSLWLPGDPSEPDRYVEQPAPESPPAPSPREPEAPAPEPDAGALLAETPPAPAETPRAEPVAPEPVPPAPAPAPQQLAQEPSPPPAPDPGDWIPPAEESPLVAGPPIELAANLPGQPPLYAAGALLSGAELEASRVDVVIRGGGDAPVVRALAPEHLAITFETQPVLYWHLSAGSVSPVELLVVERESDEVVLERQLAPPVRAGLHALDLGEAGVRLEPGVAYRFFASVVVDPERRDLDVTSGFSLEARPQAAPAVDEPAARAHRLAAAGSWLDAFATLSGWVDEDPTLERARAYRVALAEQAGLDDVAHALGEER